jgi:hypothetical protein
MKHRYIVYPFSHTTLVVDITDIGLPTEIYPPEGKRQIVPTLRFQSWRDARQSLAESGATEEMLEQASTQIKASGLAVLTIV